MNDINEESKSVVIPVAPKQEYIRGDRGQVGEPTAATTIKQMYHRTHFTRVSAEDKRNPTKQVWKRNPNAPSLKQFARAQVLKGDTVAKDWLDHKNGSVDQSRTDANIALTKTIAAATHLERRKKSAGNGKK
jgi:hypothetical protein